MPSRIVVPSCSLSVLIAGDQRSAVIFRRGPSRHVLMIRWWLASDTFEIGQWLKGRVFADRADLSHDGELLVYFAGSWRGPIDTWTAVSRPPYFTALALWPKGDTWGGGGRFVGERLIAIDHDARHMALAGGSKLGRDYRAVALNRVDHAAVFDAMHRRGWETFQTSAWARTSFERRFIYRKPSPDTRARLLLSNWRLRFSRGGPDTPSFGTDVLAADGTMLRQFSEPDWVDWHPGGDLLAANGGRLFRIPKTALSAAKDDPFADALLIADFGPLTFEEKPPMQSALRWP
jgi:hypothetical protein